MKQEQQPRDFIEVFTEITGLITSGQPSEDITPRLGQLLREPSVLALSRALLAKPKRAGRKH